MSQLEIVSVKTDRFRSVISSQDDLEELCSLTENFTLEDILMTNTLIDMTKSINDMKVLETFGNIPESFIEEVKEVKAVDYKICPECNVPCKICDTIIICESCGMERDWNSHSHDTYSMSIDQNYNTSSNSFMTFNIIGLNSYCYNRSFLKSCADYSMYRSTGNKKDIINRIYQYEGSKPPLNIINAVADLFDKIKNNGYVHRGMIKLGVIGACLYYVSIMNNVTRTPKEIALIMNIDEKFLSKGDRILQELNELKVIQIPTGYKPINDYLSMYLPALGIPEKYRQFIIDMISRAERKRLHIRHESRLTTKVIGVIYILTTRVPELKHIKKETISNECGNISKSTFIRYYTLINDNYKLMKKPFRKHKIPMNSNWK
jgi:hypothetical protein